MCETKSTTKQCKNEGKCKTGVCASKKVQALVAKEVNTPVYRLKPLAFAETADGITFVAQGITHSYTIRPHKHRESNFVLNMSHKTDKTKPIEQQEFKSLVDATTHANEHNVTHAGEMLVLVEQGV